MIESKHIFKGNILAAWHSPIVKPHWLNTMIKRIADKNSKHIDEFYEFTIDYVNELTTLIY